MLLGNDINRTKIQAHKFEDITECNTFMQNQSSRIIQFETFYNPTLDKCVYVILLKVNIDS